MKQCVFLLMIFFVSCQSPSEKIVDDFKKVEKSLDKANANIEDANNQLAETVQIDSALQVLNKEAGSIISYIETVKENIKELSGKIDTDEGMDNLSASNTIMFEQKNADTIFKALKNFKNLALSNCEQDSTKEKINTRFSYVNGPKKEMSMFFKNMPAAATLTLLSKFQNDIKFTQGIILLSKDKKG